LRICLIITHVVLVYDRVDLGYVLAYGGTFDLESMCLSSGFEGMTMGRSSQDCLVEAYEESTNTTLLNYFVYSS
jgi:hypothetical protein